MTQGTSANDCAIPLTHVRSLLLTRNTLYERYIKTIDVFAKEKIRKDIVILDILCQRFHAWQVEVNACNEFDTFLFSGYHAALGFALELKNAGIECSVLKITRDDMFDCEILKGIDEKSINNVENVRKCIQKNIII